MEISMYALMICTAVNFEPFTLSGNGFAACCPQGYEVVVDLTKSYRCALTSALIDLDGKPIPRVTKKKR